MTTDKQQLPTVALKAFYNLAKIWHLSDEEMITLLGDPSLNMFNQMKMNDYPGSVDSDVSIRISHLLGIHSELKIILNEKSANDWINKPNQGEMFKGQSALAYMLNGGIDEISRVHQYLEAQCH